MNATEFWGGTVPCAGKWALFDSTRPDDHQEAAAICATCPLDQAAACRATLAAVKLAAVPGGGPVGTWGGVLVGGVLPREHGTDRGYGQHRHRRETPCVPCKAAHNAYEQARRAS